MKSVLRDTGMDWLVESRNVFYLDGSIANNNGDNFNEVPGYKANIRNDNQQVLGIVSDKYQIVQNHEAFSFLDYMILEGLDIQKGGIIGGKKVWLVGKFGESMLSGIDTTEMYVIFTNSHDGKGSIRICITPIRVSCQNALSFAFSRAIRSWSVSHVGDINGKLHTVEEAIKLITSYSQTFQEVSTKLMNTNVDVEGLTERLFPLPSSYTEQKELVVMERRGIVRDIFENSPDLGRGTAWDFVNAVSDYATHYIPDYNESIYRGSNLNKIIKGHPIIDLAFNIVMSAAA